MSVIIIHYGAYICEVFQYITVHVHALEMVAWGLDLVCMIVCHFQ